MSDCKNKGCGCRTVITKQGEKGIQGPVGPPGPQGLIGLTGPQGIQGVQGVQGIQGDPALDLVWANYSPPATYVITGSATVDSVNLLSFRYAISGKTVFLDMEFGLNISNTSGQNIILTGIDLSAILPTNKAFYYYSPAIMIRTVDLNPPTNCYIVGVGGSKTLNIIIQNINIVNANEAHVAYGQIMFSLV